MASTRDRLVEAALACIEERGWEATDLATVRRHAGVSNGSLYHFFSGRADLGAAVIHTALLARHEAFSAVLDRAPSARDGVVDLVREQQRWVFEHRELARLLLGTSFEVLRAMTDETTVSAHLAFFDDVAAWLTRQGWSGRPSFTVVKALWVGPSLEFNLGWLATPELYEFEDGTEALADAAWFALEPILGDDR